MVEEAGEVGMTREEEMWWVLRNEIYITVASWVTLGFAGTS